MEAVTGTESFGPPENQRRRLRDTPVGKIEASPFERCAYRVGGENGKAPVTQRRDPAWHHSAHNPLSTAVR